MGGTGGFSGVAGLGQGGGLFNDTGGTVTFRAATPAKPPAASTFTGNQATGGAGGQGGAGGVGTGGMGGTGSTRSFGGQGGSATGGTGGRAAPPMTAMAAGCSTTGPSRSPG